jgi:hypothetical protein
MCTTSSSPVCGPADDQPAGRDDTLEYPLSAPIKPDDPERRSDQSKAETEGCVPEAEQDSQRDSPSD